MKNDDFLKQLNRELDGLSLPMSEKLKAEPISVKTEEGFLIDGISLMLSGVCHNCQMKN